MENSLLIAIFTFFLFFLIWKIQKELEIYRQRKYWREYARLYRERKREKELRELREWRKQAIVVNDYQAGKFFLTRNANSN